MSAALERLKKAVSMKPVKKSVELQDGSEFEFWMTPLTIAERKKAQKQAKSDDTTDFALQLLVFKAKNENGAPMFNQGDIADMRNSLPANLVESLLLLLIGEEEEEEEEMDMKSAEGTAEEGQLSNGGNGRRRKAS